VNGPGLGRLEAPALALRRVAVDEPMLDRDSRICASRVSVLLMLVTDSGRSGLPAAIAAVRRSASRTIAWR
jgi:hypothetical protein